LKERCGQQFAARQAANREQAKSIGQTPEPTSGPAPQAEDSQAKEAVAQSPQAMELASKIWEMRKRGVSIYEIHRYFGIPMEAVKEILGEFERQFYPDVGQAMAQRFALDDQRLEDLFRTWLPIATGGPVEVTKIDKRGSCYTELDSDLPLRAAGVVLQAIARRIQLTVACRPESINGKEGTASSNVLVWLSQVMPGIQKVVQQVESAPVSRTGRQELVLECEAEKLTGDMNSNGSKR
jgi:hypothetical protein